jgi:WD40 repeat protein
VADSGGNDAWATLAGDSDKLVSRPSTSKTRGATQVMDVEPGRARRRREKDTPNRTLLFALVGAALAVPLLGLAILAAVLLGRSRGSPEPDAGQTHGPVRSDAGKTTPVHVGSDKGKPPKAEPASPHVVLEGHDRPVLQLAISRDGQRAASADDRTVRLWDVQTGKSGPALSGLKEAPQSLAFAADGKRLLAGTRASLHQWNVETRQSVGATGRRGGFLSPDGRTFLVVDPVNEQFFCRVLDAATGQERGRFRVADSTDLVVSISSDGTRAAIAGRAGVIQFCDLDKCRVIRRFNTTGATTRSMALWGDRAVVGLTDGTVRLLNNDAVASHRSFQGRHTGPVWSVAVSNDGRQALSAGEDWVVRLWDVEKGVETGRFEGHTDTIRCLAFCKGDRRALSSGLDRTVRLWDLSQPTTIPPPTEPAPAKVAPSGTPPGQVFLVAGHAPIVWDVSASPDGIRALSNDGLDLRILDLKAKKMLRGFKPHTGKRSRAAVARDWRWVVTGGEDRMVRLWDLESGKLQKELGGHTGPVRCVAISADGLFALSGGGTKGDGETDYSDLEVRLWDLEKGKQVHAFTGHLRPVVDVAFSPDGKFALSSDESGAWRRWDVERRRFVNSGMIGGSRGGRLAFFKGGDHFLLTASGGMVFMAVPLGDKRPRWLKGHKAVHAVVAFPEGRWALSGGGTSTMKDGKWAHEDCTVRLWDLATGKEAARFDTPTPVMSLALTIDGRHLVTGHNDGTMRGWNLAKLGIDPSNQPVKPPPE